MGPHELTVEELHTVCASHMGAGRGKLKMAIDRRGLHLLPEGKEVALGLPPEWSTHDDERVYLRAVCK